MSTALIDVVQRVIGWLPNNINNGRLDNLYWLLVVVWVINFGYYLVCYSLYKYQSVEKGEDGNSGTNKWSSWWKMLEAWMYFSSRFISSFRLNNNGDCIDLLSSIIWPKKNYQLHKWRKVIGRENKTFKYCPNHPIFLNEKVDTDPTNYFQDLGLLISLHLYQNSACQTAKACAIKITRWLLINITHCTLLLHF